MLKQDTYCISVFIVVRPAFYTTIYQLGDAVVLDFSLPQLIRSSSDDSIALTNDVTATAPRGVPQWQNPFRTGEYVVVTSKQVGRPNSEGGTGFVRAVSSSHEEKYDIHYPAKNRLSQEVSVHRMTPSVMQTTSRLPNEPMEFIPPSYPENTTYLPTLRSQSQQLQ